MVRVAVIGTGYWGPNLIRNFAACPATRLVAVCDQDSQRVAEVLRPYPHLEAVDRAERLFDRRDIDAVAIATPVHSHGPLALAALEAGKHVLVEKPLAAKLEEAQQLVDAARAAGLTLMVDHTYLFSPAVRMIQQIVEAGELGELHYIDSVRINLGLFQNDVNVIWDLAPHDLSILDLLLGRLPHSLSATGACHTGNCPPGAGGLIAGGRNGQRAIEDVAYLHLDFGGGLLASFHVNWLSPVKVRHFIIGGSRKSLVYDDLLGPEKIKVYDRGITLTPTPQEKPALLVGYRTGDVWSPHLDQSEPLANMVRHFAECVEEGKRPLSDGESGLRIVRILEAAERNIKSPQGRVWLDNAGLDNAGLDNAGLDNAAPGKPARKAA